MNNNKKGGKNMPWSPSISHLYNHSKIWFKLEKITLWNSVCGKVVYMWMWPTFPALQTPVLSE